MKQFDVTYDVLDNKRKTFSLIKSTDILIIRMHKEADFTHMMVNIIGDSDIQYEVIFNIAHADTYVVNLKSSASRVSEIKKNMANNKEVRFAGHAFVNEENQEPVIYTENLFIQFKNDLTENDCEKIIDKYNLAIKNKISFLRNSYFVSILENTGEDTFTLAENILNRKDIEHCHPELIYHKKAKTIHPNQWHLKKTIVRTEIDVDASANVENAHKITLGKGTTIAVIDDGFDLGHPEFWREGKIVHPCSLPDEDQDVSPRIGDNHGTACAGVACADGRYGASGVAPEAKLMPIRHTGGLGSQSEAFAFAWAAEHGADVISCSWGPVDGLWLDPDAPEHNVVVAMPALTRKAIDYAVKNGREGKGCVIFFAAGNGNEPLENDGYASHEQVIAVGACNDRSKRAVYSDYGKALWCSFPSGDIPAPHMRHPSPFTKGIWTTDIRHEAGYSSDDTFTGDIFGNYTTIFSGTSSACPGAAGVAALILSVNPSLKYYEVKDIIRYSCDKIDEENGQYDENGHSKWYGYGRVNAERAVILAKEWKK
ncbi:S8 family peptidase [Yersinia frederiksenii]|uniref:S8 family peptidase n=1 Tax=Yersinia frederiksenii TaxID=29484 RepID=UPI0021BD8469|nr:S8 family serine peptidase [Yersinia frederiksenii]